MRFLLAVQREGQAVDVCLADNEALAGFVIRQDGKVEGLFGTGDGLELFFKEKMDLHGIMEEKE